MNSRVLTQLLTGSSLGMVLAVQAAHAAAPQAQAVEEIVITGRVLTVDNSALTKLTEPLLDTGQSITAVTAEELLDRGISNLNDALRTVPGISLGAGEFTWQGNTPTIRGFVARNDMFLDGIRDFGSYFRDSFNLEQVEVLQGPSSIYFGRGSTGGVINQVSKQPQAMESTYASAAIGTDETLRAVADINAPIESLGQGAAARITAMAHSAGVAGRDFADAKRFGVAPSLALGLGTPTRIYVDYFHQTEDNKPDYGLPYYFGKPAPAPRGNFYGFSDDFHKTWVNVGTVRAEREFSDAFTLRSQGRYAHYGRDFRITEALLAPGTTASTPFPSVSLIRNMWSGDSTETMLVGQLDALINVNTGGLDHDLVTGVEIGHETSTPDFFNSLGVPNVNLLNPGPLQRFTSTNTFKRVAADTSADTFSLYAVDTISLGERWNVSGGIRWDSFDADYGSTTYNPDGTVNSNARYNRVDEKPSYRAALVYKPVPEGSLYAAFGTSFNPSAEGLSFIIAGRNLGGVGNINLEPEENQSFELGAKWELLNKELTVTGAVFRVEKLNARVPDPTNPGFNMLGGHHRVDGFQLQAIGQVTPEWYVNAGYTFMDSTVMDAAGGTVPEGRSLINTPKHGLTFFTEYTLLERFDVGAGAQFQSKRLGQNTGAVPNIADAFWTFEAMARYRFTDHLMGQLNVYNLADSYYFDQIHTFHVVPAAGRSALLTVKIQY